MHTPEQAKELWCPMSRVAQSGNVDIPVAYNRSLTKETQAATVTQPRSVDDFNLGEDAAETKDIVVLTARTAVSMAANCLGDKCAMWRWERRTEPFVPTITEGAGGVSARKFENRTVRTHGFCGLAGRPEVF